MSVIEQGLSKNVVISQLCRSPHGKLAEYVPIGAQALKEDPEFFAKLTAWNQVKGTIRDSKVALPVIGIRGGLRDEFLENALAHLAAQGPMQMVQAIEFNQNLGGGKFRVFKAVVERYIRTLEKNYGKWERVAVQHRESLTRLYSMFRLPAPGVYRQILYKNKDLKTFEYPKGSVFEVIHNLKSMPATEAAGHILNRKIPFLIAAGALEERIKKEEELVLALIDRMSAKELVNNSKALKRIGIMTVPALKAAYEKALEKAKGNTSDFLKTSTAADAIEEEDEVLAAKLRALQERQIENVKAKKKGVDGDWVVLIDKSSSMHEAIEAGKKVASVLAAVVTGDVHMIFFDTGARYFNATGKTYEAIARETGGVMAGGGTSIGAGIELLYGRNIEVDGIAIVSDAAENRVSGMPFVTAYQRYVKKYQDKQIPVYLYRCVDGMPDPNMNVDLARSMASAGLDLQEFDIRTKTDYYGIPGLINTMKVDKFSLVDQIYAARLLTLDDVLGVQ